MIKLVSAADLTFSLCMYIVKTRFFKRFGKFEAIILIGKW